MFHIIGHRGTSGYAVENSLSAFQKARELHIKEIELDVRITKDNEVLIIHDENVDRLTHHKGLVRELTLNELQQMAVYQSFHSELKTERFITLEELIKEFSDFFIYHVEIKEDVFILIKKVVEIIERYQLVDHVIIVSMHWNVLKKVKELNSFLKTGYIAKIGDADKLLLTINNAHEMNLEQVIVYVNDINEFTVEEFQKNNICVRVYGISNLDDLLHAIKIKCYGATLPYPDLKRF